MTSPSAVLAMIRKHAQPLPRVGFVTAVDTTNKAATVSFADGSTTSSLSWNLAFTPAVGDRVKVSPTTTGWVVDAKITAAAAVTADVQAVVAPVNNWWKTNAANYVDSDGPWSYQLDWATSTSSVARGQVAQGRRPIQAASAGITPTKLEDNAAVLYYGSLASLVPSGSVIQMVTIALAVTWTPSNTPVAPVMYGHSHTTGSPPVEGSAPTWVSGFGPMRFPGVTVGETTVLTIPATWVTALLAGTIKGIGFYSTSVNDGLQSIGDATNASLKITYTPPAGS